MQRLRNYYNAKPRDAGAGARHESLSRRRLPSDHHIAAKKAASQQRSHLTGLAMVLNASSIGLPHYFQFLFKFFLLAYAILCLGELFHRWSNGSFLSLWYA